MTDSGAVPAVGDSAVHQSFGLTDILLFTMAVIWGINFVVVKYATHIFNPVAFTGLRGRNGGPFSGPFAFVRGGFALSRRDVIGSFFSACSATACISSSSCTAWRGRERETRR